MNTCARLLSACIILGFLGCSGDNEDTKTPEKNSGDQPSSAASQGPDAKAQLPSMLGIENLSVDECGENIASTAVSIRKSSIAEAPLVRFIGAPDIGYEVQASSDFTNWNALGNVAADPIGIFSFEDSSTNNVAMRFYRAASILIRPSQAAAVLNGNRIQATWVDNNTNETSFEIQRLTEITPCSTFGISLVGPNATSFSQFAPQANTGYRYRIRAATPLGKSLWAWTNWAFTSGLNGNVPTRPTNLSATEIFHNGVDLSWTDNSSSEKGFRLERSSNGIDFDYVGSVAANVTTYHDLGLMASQSYIYRVKAFNDQGNSVDSPQLTVNTSEKVVTAPINGKWLFVLTHRGGPIPQTAVDFFCAKSRLHASINAWLNRESVKFGRALPFNEIACLSEQVSLPPHVLTGSPSQENPSFTQPVDQAGVVNYLENHNSASVSGAVQSAKYVAIIHYAPQNTPFNQEAFGTKHQFVYFQAGNTITGFVPDLWVNTNGLASVFSHTLFRNMGASNKGGSSSQACLMNLVTALPYSGYDVMCRRIISTDGTFVSPTFMQLVVSQDTAKEIGWR